MEECNKLVKIKTDNDLLKRYKICKNYNNISIKNFDLSNRNLSNQDFKGSNLKGVKFNNSNLSNTKFINTKLEGVDFTNSNLTNTIFENSTFNKKTTGLIENFKYENNKYTEKRGLCNIKSLDIPLIFGIGILFAILISISYYSYKKN
tara:strand:- start:60 stop:503 length:444 start_codon:yes stop_codon:yes gene_type:complete